MLTLYDVDVADPVTGATKQVHLGSWVKRLAISVPHPTIVALSNLIGFEEMAGKVDINIKLSAPRFQTLNTPAISAVGYGPEENVIDTNGVLIPYLLEVARVNEKCRNGVRRIFVHEVGHAFAYKKDEKRYHDLMRARQNGHAIGNRDGTPEAAKQVANELGDDDAAQQLEAAAELYAIDQTGDFYGNQTTHTAAVLLYHIRNGEMTVGSPGYYAKIATEVRKRCGRFGLKRWHEDAFIQNVSLQYPRAREVAEKVQITEDQLLEAVVIDIDEIVKEIEMNSK